MGTDGKIRTETDGYGWILIDIDRYGDIYYLCTCSTCDSNRAIYVWIEVNAQPKNIHPLKQQQPITLSLYALIMLSLYTLIDLSDCVPACMPACQPACLYVLINKFIGTKMVLTANQVRAFFHADNQMSIPVATIVHLVQEDIEHPDDLQDFDKDSLKDVSKI